MSIEPDALTMTMRAAMAEYGLLEALVAARQLLLKTRKGRVHSRLLVPGGRGKHVRLLLLRIGLW